MKQLSCSALAPVELELQHFGFAVATHEPSPARFHGTEDGNQSLTNSFPPQDVPGQGLIVLVQRETPGRLMS